MVFGFGWVGLLRHHCFSSVLIRLDIGSGLVRVSAGMVGILLNVRVKLWPRTILRWASSTDITKYLRKVLLGLEATGHGHGQYPRIRGTQHRLSALNPL